MENTTPESVTVLDLFSGAGGLSCGFQDAGFKILSAYDHWAVAVETYRRNFPHEAHQVELHENIKLPPASVMVGGPPCQGFSSAGLRRGGDTRNTLVSVFGDLVATHLPKAFVFENVEGFLTTDGGGHLFDLLDILIEAGYRVHVRKINVANYGIPQHRKRVLVIGGLGWDPTFPGYTHSTSGAPGASLINAHQLPFSPSIEESLADLPKPNQDKESLPDHQITSFDGVHLERAKLLAQGQCMRDLPEHLWHQSYRKRAHRRVRDGTPTEKRGGAPYGLRRLRGDQPSKTITGGALREFVHPTEDRPLTVRECARLQTFPDDFIFTGTPTQKIRLIGNTVPPHFASIVAKTLMHDMQQPTNALKHGAVLSFVPTLSNGMSPILKSVTDRIYARYKCETKQGERCLRPKSDSCLQTQNAASLVN